jgi:hypothetical protein
VVPLQLHTDSSNGHNVTEDTLPMVLVDHPLETENVVVMDAKVSS